AGGHVPRRGRLPDPLRRTAHRPLQPQVPGGDREDIFSGMLTVVQDFVKDSFKSRSRVGMKRLDFGDSKILIERSPHTFLATVVFGQEPKLLPLYMLQVLKEVEDRYGTVLEKWTGLLHQLDGT